MDILRKVQLEGRRGKYVLTTWDTHRRDRRGQTIIGYRFVGPDKTTIFTGEDFAGSPMDADDSDAAVRALLNFLTLRPGDTDDEYFEKYTQRQRDFAENEAEELQMYALDEDPLPFVDLDGDRGGKGRKRRGGKGRGPYNLGIAGTLTVAEVRAVAKMLRWHGFKLPRLGYTMTMPDEAPARELAHDRNGYYWVGWKAPWEPGRGGKARKARSSKPHAARGAGLIAAAKALKNIWR